MDTQVNIAISILSALLTGGFIIFFVENQHIERDVIERFRSIMDPYYYKLSNYSKFVYFINGRIRYRAGELEYVSNFKSTIEKISRMGGEVFAYSNNIPYMSQKKLNGLNNSINNIWWLYSEAGVNEFVYIDTATYHVFGDDYIKDALSELFPTYAERTIDIDLLSFISAEFFTKVWQPISDATSNFEYWEKECKLNKRLLLLSLSFVMIIMIFAMVFSSDMCSFFITIPTIMCCLLFLFVLFKLNMLMQLSHNIFGKLPSWEKK